MATVNLLPSESTAAHADVIEVSDRQRLGAVYTPEALADWVADLALECSGGTNPQVLDLGCGEGSLLSAVASKIDCNQLIGIDTNTVATQRAKSNLPKISKLIVEDVLGPRGGKKALAGYWRRRLKLVPELLIMNPPWGAVHTISSQEARDAGLSLASGQYDTYDLFCELALQLLEHGGTYAFILPDSLFLPEHEQLRRLLVSSTTIRLIARLGEGVFPSVYRGCVVVVGRNEPAASDHQVECIRLTKSERLQIDAGLSFADAREMVSHHVLQARFRDDDHCRFDIDVGTGDQQAISAIDAQGKNWTHWLSSGRGTEISKHGRVLICCKCGVAHPLPKREAPTCKSCGSQLPAEEVKTIISVKRKSDANWAPFIVGEDVARYRATAHRWIKLGVPGIRYKDTTTVGTPRLLVRKTGVGIHAAIDTSGAVTNQVVFDYRLRPEARFPFSYLHYVLGVLASRIMFAYHLKRSGEVEWRSHPYMTQKTIAQLPVPVPKEGTQQWKQANAIANAVEAHLASQTYDYEIEGLVAGLFGLCDGDLAWANNVIANAADLEPMRLLRVDDATAIRAIRVD